MAHILCPWWFGYVLANPLRRLLQNPEKIFAPYVKEGTEVLEIGPGMGFFTIPMARMVGSEGRIFAVDLQKKMIEGLMRRARKQGLANRIGSRVCTKDSLLVGDLEGAINFVLLYSVVHEVRDKERFFSEVKTTLKRDGKILYSEPSFHVPEKEFDETLELLRRMGFEIEGKPSIPGSRSAILVPKKD